MQIESVFHQPLDQYAFAVDCDTYCLRIRVKKGDCREVYLLYGDPFKFNNGYWETEEMLSLNLAFSTLLYDFWEVKVHPPNKRLKYLFLLKSENHSIYFGEGGFLEYFNNDQAFCFTLPYLHNNEIFRSPDWVKDTIWYQIFPDRFASGNQLNDPINSLPWGESLPTNTSFYGGDLEGIIYKLDYLIELGITGIYLTPIFEANSNHKYDTINYFNVDPSFGNSEILKKLIDKCHKNNIRVMLDAVFNHTSISFPPFQDVLAKGTTSPFYEWFHMKDYLDEMSYETFSFVKEMPKLNTENKEVQKFLLDVGKFWLTEFDIDGWRLDVANEVDHTFWKVFHKEMKSIKNDVFLVGEIWHNAIPWLRGDEFDSVMNYPLLKILQSYFAYQTMSSQQFQYSINEIISYYSTPVIKSLFNILGSHDTPRILTQCNNNEKKVVLMFVFLLTYYGTPCIYYGDEIGLQGGNDPECRSCMIWDETRYNHIIFQSIKKVINLRKNYSALGNEGSFSWLSNESDANVLLYERKHLKSTIIVLINNSNESCTIPLPINLKQKRITNLWTNEQFAADSDSVIVKIPPVDFLILLIENTDSQIM